MLYHWATGDSWQLWSLNLALVTNIRHAATGMSIGSLFSTKNPSAATTKSAMLESYSHSTGCKTKNDRHSHARFLPSCFERPHSLMNKPYFSRCSGKGREGEARDVRGMRAQKSWERKKRRNWEEKWKISGSSFFFLVACFNRTLLIERDEILSFFGSFPRHACLALHTRRGYACSACAFHLSELAGLTIPAVMRILLFIETVQPNRSIPE